MATAKKRASGSWRVLVYTGKDAANKRVYESFTAPTKKEAEYLALKSGLERKNKAVDGLSVGEAVDRYIDSKAAVLSPKTVKEYKAIRQRVMPCLMTLPISKLTDEKLQTAVSEYAGDHAPKTVRNVFALIVSSIRLFDSAFRPSVTLPQRRHEEVSIPSDDEVKRLLEAAEGHLKTAILFSAALGLRRSEICALTWQDISGTSIRVSKAMVQSEDKGWVIKTTKTTSSTRTLELPPFLIDYLSTLPRDHRIVPATPDSITYGFITLRNKLNISIRFHDLRHHFASTLLEMGVPDLYAIRKMGHATPNMLKQVYQHIKDEKEKEINAAINKKMGDLFG